MTTFKLLLALLQKELAEHGSVLFLILSENKLHEILEDYFLKDIQNINGYVGVSNSWQSIFTLYGLPRVLVIKTPDAVEFINDD